MNPPFHLFMSHLRHAYAQLKTNGRVVAILPGGFEKKQDKSTKDFVSWLRGKGADIIPLPPKSFKDSDRPTMVNTCIVVIDRK